MKTCLSLSIALLIAITVCPAFASEFGDGTGIIKAKNNITQGIVSLRKAQGQQE